MTQYIQIQADAALHRSVACDQMWLIVQFTTCMHLETSMGRCDLLCCDTPPHYRATEHHCDEVKWHIQTVMMLSEVLREQPDTIRSKGTKGPWEKAVCHHRGVVLGSS